MIHAALTMGDDLLMASDDPMSDSFGPVQGMMVSYDAADPAVHQTVCSMRSPRAAPSLRRSHQRFSRRRSACAPTFLARPGWSSDRSPAANLTPGSRKRWNGVRTATRIRSRCRGGYGAAMSILKSFRDWFVQAYRASCLQASTLGTCGASSSWTAARSCCRAGCASCAASSTRTTFRSTCRASCCRTRRPCARSASRSPGACSTCWAKIAEQRNRRLPRFLPQVRPRAQGGAALRPELQGQARQADALRDAAAAKGSCRSTTT